MELCIIYYNKIKGVYIMPDKGKSKSGSTKKGDKKKEKKDSKKK